MTKRLTVSVPDDVAAHLEDAGNASAAVTAAVRSQMNRADSIRAALETSGVHPRPGYGHLPPLSAATRERIAANRDALRARRTGRASAA